VSNGASTVHLTPESIAPATTLQEAYDASGAGTQITVDATGGAFKIQDNAVPVGAAFVVQDNAGAQIFGINPTGAFKVQVGTGNPITSGGSTWNTLLVGPDKAVGRITISGSTRADMMFIDSNGAVDARIAQWTIAGGRVEWRGINDDATTRHIFVACELDTGDIGIGTTVPTTALDLYTGSNTDGLTIRGATPNTQVSEFFVGASGQLVITTRNAVGGLPFIEVAGKSPFFGFIIRESAGTGAEYANLYMVPAFFTNPATLSIVVNAIQSFNALVITATNKVAVGNLPLLTNAKLYVSQRETSAAIPVLDLEQLDIDNVFINFIGTSASDGSRSISSDTTEDSAKFGAFRVEINGTTKWIRVYDDHS